MSDERLARLEERVAKLERELAMAAGADAPRVAYGEKPEEQQAAIGVVPRGKYKFWKHDEVVKHDPQHVYWLHSNGHAESLGYTAAHVAEATRLAQQRGRR